MTAKSKYKVYQFKIELVDSEPSIWRQVQVPTAFNMFDLHGALNDAMVKLSHTNDECFYYNVSPILGLEGLSLSRVQST